MALGAKTGQVHVVRTPEGRCSHHVALSLLLALQEKRKQKDKLNE